MYAEIDITSEILGRFDVRASFHDGLEAFYTDLRADGKRKPASPHIDLGFNDGYGEWFYWTVLDLEGNWVELQVPGGDKLWANFGAAFDGDVNFKFLEKGEIWRYEERNIVIEHINVDSLIVKFEQEADFHCGNHKARFKPYTAFEIPADKWIDVEGRSRFDVVYSRGC